MALPRDARLSRQHADDQAAVADEDRDRDENPDGRALDDAAREEEAEVAEDEPARADVNRVRPREEPDAESAHDRHKHGDGPKQRAAAEEDDAAEDEEGNGVGEQMAKAEVQEGCGEDADEAMHGPRLDAVPIEVDRRQVVEYLE